MVEPVIIGDCTLYLGDCMDILPDPFVSPPAKHIQEDMGL
jgi:hypothetical protein